MRRNVYDFDGTIYNGDSTKDFYLYCVKKNFKCLLDFPVFLFYVGLYFLSIVDKKRLKEVYFRFLKRMDVTDAFLEEFWGLHERKLAEWYLDQKANGDIIITASPEFLVKPICSKLEIREVIGSDVDKNTGRFIKENCKGQEKANRLNKQYPECKIVNFYSDSLSDQYLAKLAESAYIVKHETLVPWNEYREPLQKRFLSTFFTPEFVVFVFCGGMGTLVNFLVSVVLSQTLNPILSYIIAYGISLFVTYVLNAKLVFKEQMVFQAFVRFIISYIPNFCILLFFVYLFLNILHWNKILVYALVGLLGLPITYVIVKAFAFVKKKY